MRRNPLNFPYASNSFHIEDEFLPLLSVIIPSYNHGDFLEESIKSTISQNYPNLEVIIVNDGSTDNTKDILEKFKEDNRIKVIHQNNKGIAKALNTGHRQAKGDFITWTSADNLYKENALRKMAEFLIANPSVALCYANVELINDAGNKFYNSNYRIENQDKVDNSKLLLPTSAETLYLRADNFINACFLYRKEASKLNGTYKKKHLGYEDYDFWLRLGRYGRIAHIDSEDSFYLYRLHEKTLTRELNSEKIWQKSLKIHKDLKNSYLTKTSKLKFNIHANLLLKRARDGSFNAIEKSNNNFEAILIYVNKSYPRTFIKTVLDLLKLNKENTFVLLCSDPREKTIADKINIKSKTPDNLRIIEIESSKENQKSESMLFTLGSVEKTLSIYDQKNILPQLTNAALAGIPHISLSKTNKFSLAHYPYLRTPKTIPELVKATNEKIKTNTNSCDQFLEKYGK